MPDSFDLTGVLDSLTNSIFADKLHHFPSINSTNTLALEAAQAGVSHASVWIADEQTAGRGRSDHKWHSTPGDGLYVSVLLRPQIPLEKALWLSLVTGLAAQSAIADVTGLQPDIRWPNDLLVGERKCGGILVETSSIPPQTDAPAIMRYLVIGIGINVNNPNFPEEFQALATSLYRETGKLWRREKILIQFLLALEKELNLLEAELYGSSSEINLLARFAAASTWVRGKPVSVDEAGGYTGVTDGLDSRGFLRVLGDDGIQRTVLSGGVRAK